MRIIYENMYTEESIEFKSLEELFNFINHYTVEKLIDSNKVQLRYNIIVEQNGSD